MNEESLAKRMHLDHEIHELLLFAHDLFGRDGVMYVKAQVEDYIRSAETGELIAKPFEFPI